MLQRLAAVCLCIYSPSLDQSFTAAASPSRCFVVVTKNRVAEIAGARPRTQCPELHRSMLLLLLSRLMGQPSPLSLGVNISRMQLRMYAVFKKSFSKSFSNSVCILHKH